MGAKVSDVQDALLALADQWERANDYRPGSEQDIVCKTMIGAVRAVANDDFDTMQSLLAYRRETAPTPYVPTRAERGAAGYVPKVGDKIRHSDGRVVVLTAPRADCNLGSWNSFVLSGDKRVECAPIPTASYWWTYMGPATASERAAAGLPEDEATTPPAATPAYPVDADGRPLWVRYTGKWSIDTDRPRKVQSWPTDSTPMVSCVTDAQPWLTLGHDEWEPCAAPTDAVTPAAALTEEERADLRDAIWKERTAWLATGADQRSEPDVYANAAAAWFAKRDGTVKP